MRVGILTSHRVPCGIAEYSNRFAEALARIDGIEPVILAGRADEHRSVPEETNLEVYDVATIGCWRDDGRYNLNWDAIRELSLDVIHVQYENMLFQQHALVDLFRDFDGVKAITYHDKCQGPDFPWQIFDLSFTHRWDVGPGTPEVIPFGIEERPPIIRTFGLGRTRSDLLRALSEPHGWIFQSMASHEPIRGGGQFWQTHTALIEWLRGADVIVLWYDDVDQAGSSQAARTAIASRRPVITNDTTWFTDLPDRLNNYYQKISTLEELELHLENMFRRIYVDENSWDHVAKLLVKRYNEG